MAVYIDFLGPITCAYPSNVLTKVLLCALTDNGLENNVYHSVYNMHFSAPRIFAFIGITINLDNFMTHHLVNITVAL